MLLKNIISSVVSSLAESMLTSHHYDIIFCLPAAEASPTPALDKSISRETISVKLLTSVPPKGTASPRAAVAAAAAAGVGPHAQEQAVSDHWYSAPELSEEPLACKRGAGTTIAAPYYTR